VSAALALALLCSAISAGFEETGGLSTLLQLPGILIPLSLGIGMLGPRFLEAPAWQKSPESGLLKTLFYASATISASLAALKFFDPFPLLFDGGIVLAFIVWSGVWRLEEEAVWSGLRAYCFLSTAAAVAIVIATGHRGVRFETFFHPNLWGLLCYSNFCFAGLFRKATLRIPIQAGNVVVILAAQSRSSLLATMVAGAVFCFFAVRSSRIRKEDKLLALIAAAGTCAVLAFLLREQLANSVSQALLLDDPYRGTSTGFTGRTELWQSGLRMIESYPLFGVGPRMEGHYMPGALPYAHSGYISTFAQYGLIGGTLFFGLVLIRARKLWLMAGRLRPGARVGAVLVVSYAVEAIFDPKLLSIGNPASLLLLAFLFLPGARKRPSVSSFDKERAKLTFASPASVPAAAHATALSWVSEERR